MRRLQPPDIWPEVRMANHIPVKRGTSWGPRIIPDVELILIDQGQFVYERTGFAPAMLVAGDVLCITPERPHTLRHLSDAGVFSCIHSELLPSSSWASGDYQLDPAPMLVTPTGDDDRLQQLFHQCADVFAGYAPYRDALLQTMVREIWLRLAAHWNVPARDPLSKRMAAMISYLRANLHHPVSRCDLAEAFALTPQHVNALFRQELGISPTQFVHRERILQAYRYIQQDGMGLAEAAAKVGFQDAFYFSRVFKKVTGRRPSQIR
ncbi:MAG TPA: AraC family transcriptional regulator [Armatimonadota bacterium]